MTDLQKVWKKITISKKYLFKDQFIADDGDEKRSC